MSRIQKFANSIHQLWSPEGLFDDRYTGIGSPLADRFVNSAGDQKRGNKSSPAHLGNEIQSINGWQVIVSDQDT